MPSAKIDASEMRFPRICIRCGKTPAAVHEVTVSRGIDLLFVAYWTFIDVPIPVCGPCKRHRRIAGVLCWMGVPLAILAGGFLAMSLVMAEHRVAATVVAIVIGVSALAGRFWLDDLLEWSTLGVRLVWKKGSGTPLRVTLRRPEYFAAWAAANPAATLDAGALASQATPIVNSSEPTLPRRYEERKMSNEQLSDRKMPVLMLLGLTVALALHHWYAVTQHEVFFAAIFLLPAFWMLALGGSFHPPILYSIGKYGKNLPASTKVIGALFAITGVGLGFCMAKYVYGMF